MRYACDELRALGPAGRDDGRTQILRFLEAALSLQDRYFLVVLPILLITAVVTPTLIQGIGVLVALLVCVFAIPTPLVHLPGPLDLGIADGLSAGASCTHVSCWY